MEQVGDAQIQMDFIVVGRNKWLPEQGHNTAYLKVDHWNDYSFVTMFYLTVDDEKGERHEIGNVKIGFRGQDTEKSTFSTLDFHFSLLPENYFSLGESVEYYEALKSKLTAELATALLSGLRDVAFSEDALADAKEEEVFSVSLLRSVSLSAITGQFARVLAGGPVRTDFKFRYSLPQEDKVAGIEVDFNVKADSKPSTNIHAVIGRNGVGKTTLLNGIIESILGEEQAAGKLLVLDNLLLEEPSTNYFSRLVSVSFSAFDPFEPPPEQSDPALGTCYYYIGLKAGSSDGDVSTPKSLPVLHEEFCKSVIECVTQTHRRERWLSAIEFLESDDNFLEMGLPRLADGRSSVEVRKMAMSLFQRMSSGHAVVLLSITRLVELVEEKTLVLFDEPESHLHPPLLASFVGALAELLHDRNGVAIIATHSPVVLQEIPRSCVWKMVRSRLAMSTSRPRIETYGENAGVLTREAFGLEVERSGYHVALGELVANGLSYQEVEAVFDGQLGFEARAILQSMLSARDRDESTL